MRYITSTVAIAAVCLGVFAFSSVEAAGLALSLPAGQAGSPKGLAAKNSEGLYGALRDLKASVEGLARVKDTVSGEDKERQEFRAKTQTLQKVIELGKREVEDLNERLGELRIEELVADDFTFDPVESQEAFEQMLETFDYYYTEAEKRLLASQNVNDVKKIAADMRAWRETSYNPGVKKLLSLGLVLQDRAAIKTASSRFDKILADLRKLKSAELITLDALQPFITDSGASLKKAKALNEDATNILFRILRERPGMLADNGDVTLITPHERIGNLADQSLAELRIAYKKFMELNMAVKKMLGIE